MAVQLKTCIGCVELRKGCLIIGYVSLVLNTLMSIILLSILITAGVLAGGTGVQVVWGALAIFAVISVVSMVISLGFNIGLLVGVHKDRPCPVRAYVIYTIVLIVLNIITVIANLSLGGDVASAVLDFVFIAINIYFILVINSYYLVMTSDQTPRVQPKDYA
ncbi:uncharacterized protein LOC142977018 [Anticarsia gemmatalis]|uniref:uncharacterized protein LOC142977018 n=1 Tax=Anticarsia gemmatalis TaxID=129554 RepID=UPI003F76799D